MPIKKTKKNLETKNTPKTPKEIFKSYQTHDNGGRSFEVKISKSSIKIYKKKDHEEQKKPSDQYDDLPYNKLVKTVNKYLKVWVGVDNNPDNNYLGLGNSILIKLTKSTYLHVGFEIYKFTTKDEIHNYRSPIGNNDVPYPIAFGTKNTYFMLERQYVKNEDFKKHNIDYSLENAHDLYGIFYFPRKATIKKGRNWYGKKVDKITYEDFDLPKSNITNVTEIHKRI